MADEGGGALPAAEGADVPGIYRETAAAAAAAAVVPTTSNATTGAAEDLVQKARGFMRRIVTERASPNPSLLHALAAILEQEESRSAF